MTFFWHVFFFWRNVTYPIFGPLYYLVRCLMLFVSAQETYNSFRLYSFYHEKAESFFETTKSALSLLATYDPLRYKRAEKYLLRIAYFKEGVDYYDRSLSAFVVDEFTEDDPAYFASSIVHEATHAHLLSLGFKYSRKTRERHEWICVKEQKRFIRKVVYHQPGWTQEHKENIMTRWDKWFSDALQSHWWTPEKLVRNRMSRLLELCKGTYKKRQSNHQNQ